jgi:hypothetical protein
VEKYNFTAGATVIAEEYSTMQSAPLLSGIPGKLSDEDRECAIVTCAEAMKATASAPLKRYWWTAMRNLIDGRSAAQVEAMEREKGLS